MSDDVTAWPPAEAAAEKPMILTEEPCPSLSEIGANMRIAIGSKDGVLQVLSFGSNHTFDRLRTMARSNAYAYDSIVIVSGKLEYRIWRKDAL